MKESEVIAVFMIAVSLVLLAVGYFHLFVSPNGDISFMPEIVGVMMLATGSFFLGQDNPT